MSGAALRNKECGEYHAGEIRKDSCLGICSENSMMLVPLHNFLRLNDLIVYTGDYQP
jgi:hypothetical protein